MPSNTTLLCLPDAKHTTFFGYDTIVTFDYSHVYVSWAMFFSAFVLFLIAANLIRKGRHHGFTHVRIYIICYTIVTGVFAIIRSTIDTNKVLLVGAASHNFFEWGLFIELMYPDIKLIRFAAGWIFFIISVIWQAPSLQFAFLFEQLTGLTCDYLLLFTYLYLYFTPPSQTQPAEVQTEQNMYWSGFIASATHFGQIWTLIALGLGGFGRPAISLICETLLNFTILPTFYCNSQIAEDWGKLYPKCNTRQKRPLKHVLILLSVAFFCSFFTLIIFPNLIPACPQDPSQPVIGNSITGFTVVSTDGIYSDAMKLELSRMPEPVLKEDGVISYNLYENKRAPGVFAFVEVWQNMEKLIAHLASPNVKAVFGQPYYQALCTGQQLFGPWTKVVPLNPDDKLHYTFEWDMNCSVDTVWKTLSDFFDYTWIYGVDDLIRVSTTPPIKKLILHNGETMTVQRLSQDEVSHTVVDTVLDSQMWSHFEVTVKLVPSAKFPKSQTKIIYYTVLKSAVPSLTPDQIGDSLKQDFYVNIIPFLRARFNCIQEHNIEIAEQTVKDYYNAINSKNESDLLQFIGNNDYYFDWVKRFKDIVLVLTNQVFVSEDYAAVVEDLVLLHQHITSLSTQITLFHFDSTKTKFASVKVYNCEATDHQKAFIKKYYDTVNNKDLAGLSQLYAENYKIHDPVGDVSKTIDEVYTRAFNVRKFELTPLKYYVCDYTYVGLVKAYVEVNDTFKITSYPIQRFILIEKEGQLKIKQFDAFFNPSV